MSGALPDARALRAGVLTGMLAATIGLAGCATSPKPHDVAVADSQRGMMVTLHLTDGTLHQAELLAVRDSSVVLMARNQILIGRFADITRMTTQSWVDLSLGQVNPPSPAFLREARLISRFPYGLSDASLSALLASVGQGEPAPLRPSR